MLPEDLPRSEVRLESLAMRKGSPLSLIQPKRLWGLMSLGPFLCNQPVDFWREEQEGGNVVENKHLVYLSSGRSLAEGGQKKKHFNPCGPKNNYPPFPLAELEQNG